MQREITVSGSILSLIIFNIQQMFPPFSFANGDQRARQARSESGVSMTEN